MPQCCSRSLWLEPMCFSIWGRSFWEAPFCPCVHQRGETLKGHEGEGTLWTPGPWRKPLEEIWSPPSFPSLYSSTSMGPGLIYAVSSQRAGGRSPRQSQAEQSLCKGRGVLHGSHWGRDRWVRPLERQDWVRQGLSWLERFIPGETVIVVALGSITSSWLW